MKYFLIISFILSMNLSATEIVVCESQMSDSILAAVDLGEDRIVELNFKDLSARVYYVEDNPTLECFNPTAKKFEGVMGFCENAQEVIVEVDDLNDNLFRAKINKITSRIIDFEKFYIDDSPEMDCLE